MYPKGSRDETGHKRTEGRCDLCGQRVWWCLAPPAPYSILPFEDNGDHHWWKCEEGLKIEDKVERTMRMVGEATAILYRKAKESKRS
jgi:hypothetical protein